MPYKVSSTRDNINIEADKNVLRSSYGRSDVSRDHYVNKPEVTLLTAALLGLKSYPPMERTKGDAKIVVKVVGSVEVTENSDPERLRRMGIDFLRAADEADIMVADAAERRKKQDKINRAKQKIADRERNLDEAAETLFGACFENLSMSDKAYAEKYCNKADELRELRRAVQLKKA